jgi:predicted Fe-Mo cluster-binding NifX family protein
MKTVRSQKELDSAVDPGFGQAAQLILYDTATDSCEIIPNSQGLNATQLSRHGGHALITNYFGPEAFETLAAAGMEIILGGEGLTVSQALEKHKSGWLKTSASSDVAGHRHRSWQSVGNFIEHGLLWQSALLSVSPAHRVCAPRPDSCNLHTSYAGLIALYIGKCKRCPKSTARYAAELQGTGQVERSCQSLERLLR